MPTNAVEKVKNQVAKAQTTDIRSLIMQSTSELGKALPAHMNPERLVRIALTTLRLNPELYKCTGESFLGALFQSAQLGLEPNVEGQAYIIPFNNHRKEGNEWKTRKEAQFQIGYKGYIELFYRHEKAMSLAVNEIRDNDLFEFDAAGKYPPKHTWKIGSDRGITIGFYACGYLNTGGFVIKVMSLDECMEHGKKHSKCWVDYKWENKSKVKCEPHFGKDTPWAKEPDAMCMKTVLIQLMKLLPKSIELQKAVAMDETTKSIRPGKVKVDMFEIPDETDWNDDGSQDIKAEVVEESPKTEKGLDEIEQLRLELADDIIFKNILGKSFGAENTFELTDKQIPAFKKELRAIIDDLVNIK